MMHGKIGIVCCSNGLPPDNAPQNAQLAEALRALGYEAVFSDCIYAADGVRSGTAARRAEALARFYRDPSISFLCDISGGDIANEILDCIDYRAIAAHPKPLWGYSDLTGVLNAIYAKTGVPSVLFQLRNLIGPDGAVQQERFTDTLLRGGDALFCPRCRFLQGTAMEGVVVGGNARCLLKLAGTEFFPDMSGKILLLEALGGQSAQLIAYFSQLRQLGVFHRVAGILLGTFTAMRRSPGEPPVFALLRDFIDPALPVAETDEIGHGSDAKAIRIGAFLRLPPC